MKSSTLDVLNVVVVDSRPEHYAQLTPVFEENGAACEFICTGQDAIKRPSLPTDVCWLINIHLPDMSGLDVLEMLRDRVRDSAVFIVADHYQPESEVTVLMGGAHFACKPLKPAWLQACVDWDKQRKRVTEHIEMFRAAKARHRALDFVAH